MQICLIPPIPEMAETESTGMHLVLSHLLVAPGYFGYYRRQAEKGDYLILDNGAHELGVGEYNSGLMTKAKRIGASEVVLPDVLFDERGTVELTRRMLRWISKEGWEEYMDAGAPRLMAVPQGKTRTEWARCLRDLLREWDWWTERMPAAIGAPVIGVSKDYEEWYGGLAHLFAHYIAPIHEQREIEVHCLGWANNLWGIAKVARNFPWVRSTDSAKPHVFAKNNILLEPGGDIPKYPRRDPRYFDDPLTPLQRLIARRNIMVYEAAANDEIILPV